MNDIEKYRIAIVHDYLRTFGGGERVLLELIKIFPKAKIYVATANYKRMGVHGEIFKRYDIKTSWAQKFPIFVSKPLLYRPLLPFVWNLLDIGKVDIVISSSGSNLAKWIKVPKGAIHICYCHTPPRFLYGFKTESDFLNNKFLSFLNSPFQSLFRLYDYYSNKRVDIFIANSQNVRQRIKRFYKKQSIVIYPPCHISKQEPKNGAGKYYLVVSRLVRYKNVDLIVKVFNELGLPLVVIGDGKERHSLMGLAKNNIKFIRGVPDKIIWSYYKNCKALVVATSDEDFGMTLVEAQGFGKPIVAYCSGGHKESVVDGKTGIFFNKLTLESMMKTIIQFEEMQFNSRDIWLNAKKYSIDNFRGQICKVVEEQYNEKKN